MGARHRQQEVRSGIGKVHAKQLAEFFKVSANLFI
jgi:hypothetical protein